MIIRTIHNKENPYFMLNRSAIEDDRLSYKAIGIHTYLMSKPDHWTIRETDLAARHKEGSAAVRSGLKELRDAGYIKTVYTRDAAGRIINKEAAVYEVPIMWETHKMDNPQNGQPTKWEIADIVINDSLESNEESEKTTPAKHPPVVEKRRSRQQQHAAEYMTAAAKFGLLPSDFTALVNAYLMACGTMATANADTDMGERELRKAKDAALTGLNAGILEPADVDKRRAAFVASWGDGKTPAYSQIVNQQLGNESINKGPAALVVAAEEMDGIF